MSTLSNTPLGQHTDYPRHYAPELLCAVPRDQTRQALADFAPGIFCGYDEWNLYELAWLDQDGSPKMAMGRFQAAADSPNIVESKSLKLYANSLFYKRFSSSENLCETVSSDLSDCLGSRVQFALLPPDSAIPRAPEKGYTNLDAYGFIAADTVNIGDVSAVDCPGEINRYLTHRFRSLCPVTGQPDWASVFISLDGVGVRSASLAQYLLSYAEHPGFHENCVERIFCELSAHLQPEKLCVAARFTRRGGIDINPVRASSPDFLSMPPRQIRQ